VLLTSADGTVAARYHYDAWGEYRNPEELGASQNRVGFTGHFFDTETKLYHAKARFYDPAYGRFLTADTYLGDLDDPPSLHRYLYANANPTRYTDPTGHWSWEAFRAGVKGLPRALAEPAFWVYDTTLALGGAALEIPPEFLPLQSALAQRQLARLAEGQSGVLAATKGAFETAVGVATLGTGAFAQGQYEAYRDFSGGQITLDEYDQRLSQMAGGQTGAALLGAAGSRVGGRAWTGRAQATAEWPVANIAPEAEALAGFAADMPAGGSGTAPASWAAGRGALRAGGGSQGTDAAAQAPNRIYSRRELTRLAAEPGPFHNFPESFNQQIFEQGTRTATPNFWRTPKPGMSNDSVMYRLRGTVNGVEGTFEIGVRPSASGNTEVIMHRFFKPDR
jgi:RHS repeat-associated protein